MVKKWIVGEFIKENLIKYILGISALITSSLLQLIIPKLIGYIIDALEKQSETLGNIYMMGGLIVLVSILLFAMKFSLRYLLMGRSRDLECFLRGKLFEHLQSLPPKFYNNNKTGDLMAYAINDLAAIRQAFAFGLVFLIDGIIINLTSVFVMVRTINPILTIVTLTPIVICVYSVLKLRGKIRSKFSEVQKAFADVSDKIQENISGIRVIKAYVQEDEEINKVASSSLNKKDKHMDYIKISAALAPMIQVFFGISFTLAILIGSRYVRTGVITLGDFIAFNTYLTLLTAPVNHLGKIVEVWQKAAASIKRLDDIFAIKSDIISNSDEGINEIKGKITIKNLDFIYPYTDKKVLNNINIEIPEGKTLGIIGKTGSGKSTIVNLLLRLYKIDNGKIFIDDKDINDIPIEVLRENIGYVPQDNFLFSTTIKENIEFFNEIYDEKDIEEATKISAVYDNIIDFPEGFETIVGERGITLSGGQKQRISIARAVIKSPAILVLDDSLSAVDTRTEDEILSNIKNILKNRTGIIIAHRISTIKDADEIIVLDKGTIIERGKHEELLALGKEYYKLYKAQSAESSLEDMKEVAI